MAYLYMNPTQHDQRVNFQTIESAVKQALGDKKKQERKLHTQTSKTKKANYINRVDHRNTENGIETCGYNRTYEKGIILTLRAFEKSPPFSIDKVIEQNNRLNIDLENKRDGNDL